MDEDRGQIFPVNQQLFNNLILDLLIEIRASQMAYHKLYGEQIAGKLQLESNTIHLALEAQMEKARAFLVESLYAEYGDIFPDIKNLLKL